MPEVFSSFVYRHIGPRPADIKNMLETLGFRSLDEFTAAIIPKQILDLNPLPLEPGISEEAALAELKTLANENRVLRSFIGQGYYDTFTPKVLQRNVLENPAWYTAYTPYQPEISQGRLELLFYFQTLIRELTGLPFANASLLDEGTAAAEGMTLCFRKRKGEGQRFLASRNCHPQTIEILRTRAQPLGIDLELFDDRQPLADWSGVFGLLVQYPGTDGRIHDFSTLINAAHQHQVLVVMATDLLALMLLRSPADLGADVAIGNSQRFGVPLGFGGPHAAFMATTEPLHRSLPGRLVGRTFDRHGDVAYRLAIQTREQHIQREKATSNICTAQALLAMMATLYAIYHGPEGLRAIAERVHRLASKFYAALHHLGVTLPVGSFFDTVVLSVGKKTDRIMQAALDAGFNLRRFSETEIGISFDETTTETEVDQLLKIVAESVGRPSVGVAHNPSATQVVTLDNIHRRTDTILSQEVFHRYRSETEMMRYLRKLSELDIALDRAMIPLGSCTMKLNAASELTPITWPQFNRLHPFAPADQWLGYRSMIAQIEHALAMATGYDAVSLQPNAGSQGEYAGLLAIMAYHASRGDHDRNVCLIPTSAHGTNPASAQMAHMKVVPVKCDEDGNVDLVDLDAKLLVHGPKVAAIMITYPSTHGVFEETVTSIREKVHAVGGQVYIDGANLNALVGVAKPGKFGGDVSHLNLHKTFCIPHGGGGPGVGPVAVRQHLAPFLPKDGHNRERTGPMVSAAPFGSASILPITWMYLRMMGGAGLKQATQVAMLNANYLAFRLKDRYPILYTGQGGLVAHECIIDTRPMNKHAKVLVDDLAKRLIDFGFHAPTMSFPVPGTLMIEPTESESKEELDRFCRAMLCIYEEYEQVRSGVWPADNNPLRNAPHSLKAILDGSLPYSRQQAVCPDNEGDHRVKYWPPVGRIDGAYGDRNLVCACPPVESYK